MWEIGLFAKTIAHHENHSLRAWPCFVSSQAHLGSTGWLDKKVWSLTLFEQDMSAVFVEVVNRSVRHSKKPMTNTQKCAGRE